MASNRPRRAIIAGIGGQDGSYLAELLVAKGYRVLGFMRKDGDTSNLTSVIRQVDIEGTEWVRREDIVRWTRQFEPDEVYNLAAMSFIPASWENPTHAFQVNTLMVTALLEALRETGRSTRYYQASSSEIFGDPPNAPQDETTPFNPMTPYGVSKLASHLLTGLYRRRHGMFAVSGILYNHESPRRQSHFVTQKIAIAAAEIAAGRATRLKLGNIDAQRDWGYAVDFVRGIWQMLQQDHAEDYVLATGELHSIRDFLEIAFARVRRDWRDWVEIDTSLVRPVDVGRLVGNAQRAREKLGWSPQVTFEQLVTIMVDAQVKRLTPSLAREAPAR